MKLEYYADQPSSTKGQRLPKGIIDLRSTLNMTKTNDNIFVIKTKARDWTLKASKKFVRDSWFNSIFHIWQGMNKKQAPKQNNPQPKYDGLKSAEGSNQSNVYPKLNDAIFAQDNEEGAHQITQLQEEPGSETDGGHTHGIKDAAPSAPNGFIFHRIKAGDTLVALSIKYEVSQNKIKKYNSDICFGHRLAHITGKLLLIPTMANAVLTDTMKKEIDAIYKRDHQYNLNDLDDKKYDEPDENGKGALRKALMYHAKGLDQLRCDYYLNAGHWNVRKALKLWQKDDVWEKQNKLMKKFDIDADEAMQLLEQCQWNIERAMRQKKEFGNNAVVKNVDNEKKMTYM